MNVIPHETYMQRCLQLAQLGAGNVAPNPMVGAVLVFEDRIIGEGYHMKYGEAHAEVNCVNSVRPEEAHLISRSTMYVSLEPCAHFGKTPPCADFILRKNIPKVVVGCRDSFDQVDGKGIQKLKAAGVHVTVGVLQGACENLNRRFFHFHKNHRPCVILKWAQTQNGIIGNLNNNRLLISSGASNQLVHKWRSEEAAIMVGTNTAAADDPSLTTRLWPGADPLRVVIDMDLKLPGYLKLFNHEAATIVFNKHQNSIEDFKDKTFIKRKEVAYYQVTDTVSIVPQIMNALYHLQVQSIIVEGGARLLQSFIDDDCWDEARVITNTRLTVSEGIPAPVLKNEWLDRMHLLEADQIRYYRHQ